MLRLFYRCVQSLCSILLCLSFSRKTLILQLAVTKKENEILLRQLAGKQIRPSCSDRFMLSVYAAIGAAKNISIFHPETVLKWQRAIISNRWTFPSSRKPGRPCTAVHIREMILEMKNSNTLWGPDRIRGELLKLGISLDRNTIRSIISDFRKQGKILPALTWKKFLTAHFNSLYAADFLTVDSLPGTRYYVLIIMRLATREIVHYAVTPFPTREFVRQQMSALEALISRTIYLIHDNSPQFDLDYKSYSIHAVAISSFSPNMNAYAERFMRSIRREVLDHFIIISEKQLRSILSQYIAYYNTARPHQGIGQDVPSGFAPQKKGSVRASPVLGGLHHHYYREAA